MKAGYNAGKQAPKSADPTVGARAPEVRTAYEEPKEGNRPVLPDRYVIKSYVGGGAYGKVWLAEDVSKEPAVQVAVKWIQNFSRDPLCGKRTLREIKLLAQLRHENLMKLYDLCPMPSLDSEDIVIVMPYVNMDLHKVIFSQMRLSPSHVQAFVCQILRGLKYLHSAGVWHRDLKPGNILVNKDCTLKIADFGLARGHKGEDSQFSEYVVTRWYRSPEIFLLGSYNEAVDLWSVGCIHGELLIREPLFPGKDTMQMLKFIIERLGFDHDRDLAWLPTSSSEDAKSTDARQFARLGHSSQAFTLIASLKPDQIKGQPLEQLLKEKGQTAPSEACLDFIRRLLVFNPSNRISAVDAIDHEYLRHLHDPEGEKEAPKQFPWDFDDFDAKKRALQDRVYAECARLHPEIITRDYDVLKARGLIDGEEGSASNGNQGKPASGAPTRPSG